MRNTWHGDCHVSRWIKKGVLHLDQKEFGGGRMRKRREKIERIERKEKEKGVERRSNFYWSPVFEQQDVRWVRK